MEIPITVGKTKLYRNNKAVLVTRLFKKGENESIYINETRKKLKENELIVYMFKDLKTYNWVIIGDGHKGVFIRKIYETKKGHYFTYNGKRLYLK